MKTLLDNWQLRGINRLNQSFKYDISPTEMIVKNLEGRYYSKKDFKNNKSITSEVIRVWNKFNEDKFLKQEHLFANNINAYEIRAWNLDNQNRERYTKDEHKSKISIGDYVEIIYWNRQNEDKYTECEYYELVTLCTKEEVMKNKEYFKFQINIWENEIDKCS